MSSSRAPTIRDNFMRISAVILAILALAALMSARYQRKTQGNVLDMKYRQMNSDLVAVRSNLESLDGDVRKTLSTMAENDIVKLKTSLTSLRDEVKQIVSTLKDDVVGAKKATAEDAARVQSLAAQLSDSFTASAALRRRVDRQQQQMDSVQGLLESMQDEMTGRGATRNGGRSRGQQQRQQGQHQQQARSSQEQGSTRGFERSLIGGNLADTASRSSGRHRGSSSDFAGIYDTNQLGEEDLEGGEGNILPDADQDAVAKMELTQGRDRIDHGSSSSSSRRHSPGSSTPPSPQGGHSWAGQRGSSSHVPQKAALRGRSPPELSSDALDPESQSLNLSLPGRQDVASDHNLQEFAAGSLKDVPIKSTEAAQAVGGADATSKRHAHKAVQDLHKAVYNGGKMSGKLGRKGTL